MLTDQEFTELLEDMNSGEVSLLAAALIMIRAIPFGGRTSIALFGGAASG